jgi:hypothetical protein
MNFKRHILIPVLSVGGILFSAFIVYEALWIIEGDRQMAGVMKSAKTNWALKTIAEVVEHHRVKQEGAILPQISDEFASAFDDEPYPVFQNQKIYDAWDHPMRVTWSTVEKGKIEIRSAGADGIMDTADDLVKVAQPRSVTK